MPQQQTITTYNFSELSEAVQEKLINDYELSDYWDEWVIDTIKEEASELGIENFDFHYSGFWSQGDGASFTGTLSTDLLASLLKDRVNEELSFDASGCSAQIDRKSYPHYVHENMVYASFDSGDESVSDEDCDAILAALEEWKNELCLKWYQLLYDTYEAETSEERIKEEYKGTQFLEDGRFF
jgi:hypothetical protein